jgi:PKD repeat protein
VAIGPKSHTYADGPNDFTVHVTVTDKDGGTDTKTFAVHVNNVAPTVTLDPSNDQNVDEGTTHTYKYTVSDPGIYDTFTVDTNYPSCGTNGTVTGTPTKTDHGGSFDCYFPDGPAMSNVEVRVTDNNGGHDAASENVQVVNVANVPPTVTAPAAQSSNEGENHSFALGSFSDPGSDSPWSVSVDWGDGSALTTYQITGSGPASGVAIGPKSHTYADGPNDFTVHVTVSDPNAGSDTKTFAVHVNNVAPTATLSNDGPVNEGSPATASFSNKLDPSNADTAAGFHYAYDCNNGDLSGATYANTVGSSDSTICTYPDGPSDHTVKARIIDKDGGFSEYTTSVHVNNVAPIATFNNNGAVNEGSNINLSLDSPSDPSSADTTAGFQYRFSCDNGATWSAWSSSSTATCSTNDNGTRQVKGEIRDKDGGVGSYSANVTVNNVAPTAALGNNGPVNEGSPVTVTFSAQSDPSSADTAAGFRYDYHCDGSIFGPANYATASTSVTAQCAFNDQGTYTVRARIIDKDNGYTTYTTPVVVNNVPPIVTLSGPNTAGAGDTKTYTFTISDPGADTQSYAVGYPTCGLNGTINGTPTITNSGGSFQCTFGTGASSTVSVKVNDGTANSNESSIPVTVNRPPTVSSGGNVSGAEGSAIALHGTASDPDGDTFTVKWTYTTGAGVDAGAMCSFANDAMANTTITCTDDGMYNVKLEATDSKGAKSSSTAVVTVSNANPVVTAANQTPDPKAVNIPVTVVANFTDAGKNDTHTCMVDWQDGPLSTGTVAETAQSGSGSCSATHTYTAPGVYTVTTTVTDDDGGSGSATTQVVIYDPSAGFITGGGWINVDPQSLTTNLAASGRANFGFSSQYKKGATIPTGETEFNFQMGNFNFHSEAYTWLVVSGYKAQYKGTGSVNGVSGYDFTLTAYDGDAPSGGGVDKFRIRITRTNGGNVIFDNRMGVATTDIDTANPEAISGGSIVIHKA